MTAEPQAPDVAGPARQALSRLAESVPAMALAARVDHVGVVERMGDGPAKL